VSLVLARTPRQLRSSPCQRPTPAAHASGPRQRPTPARALACGAGRRLKPSDDFGGDQAETVFDSPLQESIVLLRGLGARLETLRLGQEAETVRRVMHLLHSPELQNSKNLRDLLAAGDVQARRQQPARAPSHTPGAAAAHRRRGA